LNRLRRLRRHRRVYESAGNIGRQRLCLQSRSNANRARTGTSVVGGTKAGHIKATTNPRKEIGLGTLQYHLRAGLKFTSTIRRAPLKTTLIGLASNTVMAGGFSFTRQHRLTMYQPLSWALKKQFLNPKTYEKKTPNYLYQILAQTCPPARRH
jgi:hypothetical protein